MSNFLYPPKYMVYQQDPSGTHWVPALFDHRERQYFVTGDVLDDLVGLVMDGMVTGDADPIADIRVVEIGSGDLYALNIDRSGFHLIDRDWDLSGPDKLWFDFN